jgi:zinc transport system substrate-binding protein
MAEVICGIGLGLLTGAAMATAGLAAAPAVVTDTPVVHSLVSEVMAGVGVPFLLLDKGADPHDFQMRPSQAAALADADLVVWVGPEMTPWLPDSIEGERGLSSLELLSAEGTILRQATGDEAEHDYGGAQGDDRANGQEQAHADDAAHDGSAVAGAVNHDHGGGRDPHAWLDPRNAGVWLSAIAAELSRIDPDNAPRYAANADQARARIHLLDQDIARRLVPSRGVALGVYHDAYGYFAARYGLTIAGSIAAGDAHDPGAAHLADLEHHLHDATCMFPEEGHDTGAPETLAADVGLRVGPPLNPEGIGMEPGPDLYPALLTSLADGILACVKGG